MASLYSSDESGDRTAELSWSVFRDLLLKLFALFNDFRSL